jgi:hypothetical protein
MDAPGLSEEALTFHNGDLWVCDRLEETVFCIDPKSGEIKFRALTPFANPTGIGFHGDEPYIVYTGDEHYIRDNPNDPNPLSVAIRDHTFIHRLSISHHGTKPRYTLSNGYLVEMIYLEETACEDPQDVHNLTWKIALPDHTDRQKVISTEAIGMPYEENVDVKYIERWMKKYYSLPNIVTFNWVSANVPGQEKIPNH